ncbi:MAG: hypothetical protein R2806_03035 [Saprospiraceae bacterium]
MFWYNSGVFIPCPFSFNPGFASPYPAFSVNGLLSEHVLPVLSCRMKVVVQKRPVARFVDHPDGHLDFSCDRPSGMSSQV